jgi:uncharacterized membrane protein HdeD (DUF308 family)
MAGLACVAVGIALTFRPFTSLSVLVVVVGVALIATGVGKLTDETGGGRTAFDWLAAAAWIAAGVVALGWPELTTRGIALIAGASMIVGGVLDALSGIRGTSDERLACAIWGVASVVLGLLALEWPDVTLLVVGVVFGVRTAVFGARLAFAALRRPTGNDAAMVADARRPRGLARRWAHVAAVSAMLLVALGLAGLSAALNRATGDVDDFYTAPDEVPGRPGQLLRQQGVTKDVPDGATGWRILYTTTRAEDEPAVASALVIVPDDAAGPVPVIAWAHGTTGVARRCAPTIMPRGLAAGAFQLTGDVLRQGWALIATDYVGLGTEGPHPYLIGQGEGRSVLDAVRAARQIDDADLTDEAVVWGHSQGGHAALWTGIIAPTYAPDVPLGGVAAVAPASDLIGLVDHLPDVTGGSIFATYVVHAYSRVYEDVSRNDYVRGAARTTFDATAGRCLDATALASVLGSVAIGFDGFIGDFSAGALAPRLDENIPDEPIEAPLLIGQGAADSLVLPEVQQAFVAGLCAGGQAVDYRTYAGRDHVPVMEPDSPLVPELIEWTQARLAGADPTPTCGG